MSPHPCSNCFLFETRGVCPMARQAYGLETPAEVQRRAEALRAAIAHDAPAAPGLADLVRLEAQQHQQELQVSSPRLLPAPPVQAIPHDSRKEVVHVVAPRPLR
jgi:hypothetical protein